MIEGNHITIKKDFYSPAIRVVLSNDELYDLFPFVEFPTVEAAELFAKGLVDLMIAHGCEAPKVERDTD